ncbi:histone-like nucleoid-structuring protein, MvaT/MvaU family [Pseudomonas aeruginosa]
MSLLSEYNATQQKILQLQESLKAMENDPKLQKEKEFETALRELLSKYSKSLRDIVAILDPKSAGTAAVAKEVSVRRPRKLKTYKNPHTGEVIETKGGNHKTLKAWKAEYGSDAVESWLS